MGADGQRPAVGGQAQGGDVGVRLPPHGAALAGVRVPDARGPIVADGDDVAAVGAEGGVEDVVLAQGRQKTRFAAKYQAERALFQLLTIGWKRPGNTAASIKQGKTRRA